MELKGKLLSIVLYPPNGGKWVTFAVEEVPDELNEMQEQALTITVELTRMEDGRDRK